VADDQQSVVITEEHFFGPLGIDDVEGLLPEQRRELFAALVADLASRDLVLDPPVMAGGRDTSDLELRLPGTPIHVHLAAVGDAEMKEIVMLLGIFGLTGDPGTAIGLAGLQSVRRLVRKLHTDLGERSIVEMLGKAKPPTAVAVAALLHGAACRHPKAGCRYDRDGTCSVTQRIVAATLNDLTQRQIVQRRSAVEPHEYKVAF